MPWPCQLVPAAKSPKEVGDVWFAEWAIPNLSPEYDRDWRESRAPVVIRLPGHVDFCPDRCADDSRSGWVVTGTTPHLTFSPSVNIGRTWHGFVRGGVISDDVEGRQYDPTGRPLP